MTTCKSQFFYYVGPKTGLKASQLEALSYIRDPHILVLGKSLKGVLDIHAKSLRITADLCSF